MRSHYKLQNSLDFPFSKLTCTDIEITLTVIFFPLLNLPLFQTKYIKRTHAYETYVQSLHFRKKDSKTTNHPDIHIIPT